MPKEEQDKQKLDEYYNTKIGAQCGRCGCDLTYGNDMGDGFCKNCHEEDDRI